MSTTSFSGFAPVPKGHQVRVMVIERPGGFLSGPSRLNVVIDDTAGTFYLPYDALADLKHCTTPEALEATIGTGAWKVVSTYRGQVVGSAVSVKDARDINDVWTRLFLMP